MDFLFGQELSAAIKDVLTGDKVKCAVAFWGKGSEDLLRGQPQDIQLLCNLMSGGTNPFVIENFIKRGVVVRQCDTIHAKVYIGRDTAIVTSANASINGLGFEGLNEQAYWIEAGVSLRPSNEVTNWFVNLWSDRAISRDISAEDMELAKERWKRRPRPPFDIEDRNFVTAFKETLKSLKYERLRTDDYEEAWFRPRVDLTQSFWRDAQKKYKNLNK